MDIDGASLDKLDTWVRGHEVQEGDLGRVLDFLRSVEDGTWLQRWYIDTDLTAPLTASAAYVIHLRPGLRLVVYLNYDGIPNIMHVPSILVG